MQPQYSTTSARLPYRKTVPLPERFWRHVNKTEGCWLWAGAASGRNRYGYIGDEWPSRRILCAHRVSWLIHYGPIPDGLHVCHTCDTPLCVRPDHLFLGTEKQNMADKVAKGRQKGMSSAERFRCGLPISNTHFTPEKVRELRRLRALGHTQQQIAEIMSIDQTTVSLILSGKTWGWVT